MSVAAIASFLSSLVLQQQGDSTRRLVAGPGLLLAQEFMKAASYDVMSVYNVAVLAYSLVTTFPCETERVYFSPVMEQLLKVYRERKSTRLAMVMSRLLYKIVAQENERVNADVFDSGCCFEFIGDLNERCSQLPASLTQEQQGLLVSLLHTLVEMARLS